MLKVKRLRTASALLVSYTPINITNIKINNSFVVD